MCANAPSGAHWSPATTGPGVSDGDGVSAGTSGAAGRTGEVTTTDGLGSGAGVAGRGEGGAGGGGAWVGMVARRALRSVVVRLAVVGCAAEELGGAGTSGYSLAIVGGGVAGGAAIWSTVPPEPLARPRVSHPINPTSSA